MTKYLHTIAALALSAQLLAGVALGQLPQDLVRENLGPAVNSPMIEAVPVISPDGKTLYFCRPQSPEVLMYDIWYSTLQRDGSWTAAQLLPGAINNENDNKVFAVSPDGSTMYLRGEYAGIQPGDLPFYRSELTAQGWGQPVQMTFEGVNGLLNASNNITATISNDGLILILSDDSDIYLAQRRGPNTWSRPEKLLEPVSTISKEYAPFLSSDNKTLYFSSDRRGGFGSQDIYKTTRTGSGWAEWSAPVNLGPSINSPMWEAYFVISASGGSAYTTSWENTLGEMDIFRVQLKPEERPEPVVLVRGRVLDAQTRKPLAATIVYEELDGGQETGKAHSKAEDGSYTIVLPYGADYGLRAVAPGYIPVSENLELKTVSSYQEVELELLLAPMSVGQRIRLNNLFFERAVATLLPQSMPELERLKNILLENPNMTIEIGGHTERIGDEYANIKLSLARANRVKSWLVEHGIATDRLKVMGYGSSKPINNSNTEAERAKNRRVEITILRK